MLASLLPRRVREDGRRVAVRGAPALRRLVGGARTVMTATDDLEAGIHDDLQH